MVLLSIALSTTSSGEKIGGIESEAPQLFVPNEIDMELPAILKPVRLWSGKQVGDVFICGLLFLYVDSFNSFEESL